MKKLQNEKTGEICEFMIHKRIEDSEDGNPVYAPFTGSIEDWKDYEEPKGIQGLTTQGEDIIIRMGSIDEAEKAVEKLKAWTRLRKKGFKFTDYKLYRGSKITDREFAISAESPVYVDHKDLDLLFGGEE